MLLRNLIREIITLHFLDKKKLKKFLARLKNEFPYPYKILIHHPYYWGARILCNHRSICRFTFTYVIKQQSILDDLELFTKRKA